MKDSNQCPECGAVIPNGQPKGLCSRCALSGLLKAHDGTEALSSLSSQPVAGETPRPSAERVGRAFGDYELLAEIARGGMGVVYKARQKSLNRVVAVKMLLFGANAGADFIKRFRLEASAAAALQHPNIVAIHEVGVHDGDHFLVMDYVEGSNLRRLAREQILPPKRSAQYLKTIAEAIHYAHEQGILHRDLKPSNVLIDANDQPRVTDFGLAKVLTSDTQLSLDHVQLTQTGHILGSPAYMPPEQASGARSKISRPSDVYSLGAMLYHLLTGRPPFGGGSISETLKQVETQEPISPRLLNPGVPLDLETLCLKCLEKDPDRRYQTSKELSEELGRFLNGETTHARPVGRPEKLWRWSRRNPLAAAFVVVVCAALVSSIWLLYLVNREKNKQMALVEMVKDRDRANLASLKRTLGMLEESLERMWDNRAKESIELFSEDIAALAQMPELPVTNKAALVRLKMGMIAEDRPGGRVRQHATLLAELEARSSLSLDRQVRVDVKIYKFVEDFFADLRAGKVDFGRMAALPFLRSRRTQPALIPLVVPATSKSGLFFTRRDTGIQSIRDILGHSVAFGDTNATVSYWAQIRLTQSGITATDLARYEYLDSTLDFVEEVQEKGYSNAVSRIGYLHSHAQVIEGVVSGRYDVGVATRKAFKIHEHRGLVAIPGAEFESSLNVWVARPNLDPKFEAAIINAMISLQGRWLETLPDQSPGYRGFNVDDFAVEEQWLDRVEAAFPPKPSPPRIPVPDSTK